MRLRYSMLFLAIASVASADTVPALTWSGVANATGGFYLFPANANVTTNGIFTYDSWKYVTGSDGSLGTVSNNFYATTAFTVTSPGDFQLSGIADFDLNDTTCTDLGCVPIGWDLVPLKIDLTTTVSILDSMGNTVGSESFTGSASAPYGNCELFPWDNQEYCTAEAQVFSTLPNGIFNLSTGSYTLDLNVSSSGTDLYGNVIWGTPELEGDLIATPEPREWWILLALSAVLYVARKRLCQSR